MPLRRLRTEPSTNTNCTTPVWWLLNWDQADPEPVGMPGMVIIDPMPTQFQEYWRGPVSASPSDSPNSRVLLVPSAPDTCPTDTLDRLEKTPSYWGLHLPT